MKQMQDKEVFYKPVRKLESLILCYIIFPTLCILSNCPFWLLAFLGPFLVYETFSWVKRRKEVIALNSEGIVLYRVKGTKNKDRSSLFVDWKLIDDIRFNQYYRGLDIVIYHKTKGCIQMDISDYISLYHPKKRYKQFKKDVYHYFNSAQIKIGNKNHIQYQRTDIY